MLRSPCRRGTNVLALSIYRCHDLACERPRFVHEQLLVHDRAARDSRWETRPVWAIGDWATSSMGETRNDRARRNQRGRPYLAYDSFDGDVRPAHLRGSCSNNAKKRFVGRGTARLRSIVRRPPRLVSRARGSSLSRCTDAAARDSFGGAVFQENAQIWADRRVVAYSRSTPRRLPRFREFHFTVVREGLVNRGGGLERWHQATCSNATALLGGKAARPRSYDSR